MVGGVQWPIQYGCETAITHRTTEAWAKLWSVSLALALSGCIPAVVVKTCERSVLQAHGPMG